MQNNPYTKHAYFRVACSGTMTGNIRDCQKPPEGTRETGTKHALITSRRNQPCPQLMSDFRSPEPRDSTSLLSHQHRPLRPPSLCLSPRGQSFTCQPGILYLLPGGSLSWSSCLLKSSFFRSLIASHPLWPLHRECDGQISGIQNQNEMKRMSRPPKRKGEQCFYRIKQAQMTQHSVEA